MEDGAAQSEEARLSPAEVWKHARSVFDRVSGIPRDERAAVLESLAPSKPVLDAVERLLRSQDSVEGFLDDPQPAARASGTPSGLPNKIGPYEPIERLGEGGFGVVYRARQRLPIDREVAIKLLKPGLDSPQLLARFTEERQFLARIDHPDIVKVLDAGATPEGQLFVVMELAQGEPITAFARSRGLPIRRRVELVARVARAVHAVHQRAIIHRDLKPSNIMVTEDTGGIRPRVIDFGIATAIEQSDRSGWTQLGTPIGTPRYGSPEQVRGKDDVDIRTDVYALGMVLCETLTGELPRESPDLHESPAEAPSRLVGRSGDVDGETVRAIRGDLDRIVLKAVAWDPELRYDSAAALADDLDRFIRGEAVLASGPSPVYVARKFVSRHVAASVLALVAVLALMAGLGAAVLGLGEALRQREEARENGARAALVGETLLRTIAESADPDVRGKPSPLSVQDLSNLAEQALEAAQRDPEAMLPVVEQIARLQTKLENSPGAVETLGAAIRIAESHYGTPHERVISLLVRQYDIQSSAGIHGRRETIDHAMAQARELWPEDRPEFLRVLQRTPISLAEMEALAARYEREGIASPSDEMSLVARMMMAHRFGPTPDKQIGLSRRLLELSVAEDGPNASYSIMALGTLGDCLVVYERDRSGVPMLEEADERATSVLGEAHWLTGTIRRNRAMAYGLMGEPERGIPILEHLIDNVPPSSLGEVSQTNTRNSYGGLLMQAGRHDDAIRVLTEVLSTRRTQWSAGNRNIVQTLMDLSAALLALGRAEEALPMTEEALRHSDPAMRASQYARAATLRMINLREVGRSGEAEELLEQAGGRLRIAGAADDLIAGLGLDGLSR